MKNGATCLVNIYMQIDDCIQIDDYCTLPVVIKRKYTWVFVCHTLYELKAQNRDDPVRWKGENLVPKACKSDEVISLGISVPFVINIGKTSHAESRVAEEKRNGMKRSPLYADYGVKHALCHKDRRMQSFIRNQVNRTLLKTIPGSQCQVCVCVYVCGGGGGGACMGM